MATKPATKKATPAGRRAAAPRRSAARPAAARIGFIGGGNMASALIRGFLAARLYKPGEIIVSDVEAATRRAVKGKLKVAVTADNRDVAAAAPVLVLAVKPQTLAAVLEDLRPALTPRHLVISIAAGWPTARIERALGGDVRVVRAMPNTPALLGKGMAVAVRGRYATPADEKLVLTLLRTVGRARAVPDERMLDAVTGLSGSGPAYVYLFAEAMIAGGVAAGLTNEAAQELALQTLTGAAAMLQESGEPPARLRDAVTSPGGTTQAGLDELRRRGFGDAVQAAITAATRRATELGQG